MAYGVHHGCAVPRELRDEPRPLVNGTELVGGSIRMVRICVTHRGAFEGPPPASKPRKL